MGFILFYKICFLFVLVQRVSRAEYCSENDSIFDKGLEKVLLSEQFAEIPLPDIAQRLEDLFGTSVSFTRGRLTGLQTMQRTRQSALNAGQSGCRVSFHVKGGPVEAHYVGRLSSVLLRKSFRLAARVPSFEASFTAEERSPNHLQLQVHGVRMSSIRLRLGRANIGSYGFITELVRPSIQEKIEQLLARELRKLAEKTLGAVKVYAAHSEEGSVQTRAWRSAFNSASSYLALIRGQPLGASDDDDYYDGPQAESEESWPPATSRGREPRFRSRERERWLFDGCLSTLVVSTGFEPASLPEDLEEFSCSLGSVSVSGGNVTGLSSAYTRGDSMVKVGDCGLSARFHLGFNDLIVSAVGSVTKSYVTTSVAFDVRIPAVEVVLKIRERNNKLEIVTYNLDFTAPVHVKGSSLGAIGSFVKWFGGVQERTLEDAELEQLKNASRKYVQKVVDHIAVFIADPPMPNML